MNEKVEGVSPLFPQQSYLGQDQNPQKDPFDRRKVKQLGKTRAPHRRADDISFESDDELEETKCVKRLPNTVLTEENLKTYLSHHLERLFIDNHHWLRENFIDKIGRLSPNIRVRKHEVTRAGTVDPRAQPEGSDLWIAGGAACASLLPRHLELQGALALLDLGPGSLEPQPTHAQDVELQARSQRRGAHVRRQPAEGSAGDRHHVLLGDHRRRPAGVR